MYPIEPETLSGYPDRYTSNRAMTWKWKSIREHFKDRMRAAKRNQQKVAAAGGLDQSAISKLVNNERLGPTVEVFLNAIEGLGMSASEFFRQLERAEQGHQSDVDVTLFISHEEEQTRELARQLRRLIRQEIRDVRLQETRRLAPASERRKTRKT